MSEKTDLVIIGKKMIRKKKNFKSSNVKSKRRPQNMSEKIQFWTPDKKMRGEGQNMSENIDLVIIR